MEKVLFKKLYLKSIRTVREGLWLLSYNPLPSFSPRSSERWKFYLSECTTSSPGQALQHLPQQVRPPVLLISTSSSIMQNLSSRQRLFSGQRVPHPSPSCRVKTLPLLGRPRLWDPKHPYLSYVMEWRFHMRKSTSSLSGISDFIQCHTHGAGMSAREKQAVVPNLSSRTVTWSSDQEKRQVIHRNKELCIFLQENGFYLEQRLGTFKQSSTVKSNADFGAQL